MSKKPDDITASNVIAALQLIQAMNADGDTPHVHGVLIPLQFSWDNVNYACGYSPLCVEVDRLVNSGVVVMPAGDAGFDPKLKRALAATITDPGNAPNAITVGSTHRKLPHEYGPSFF